jgi:hypothetical protein
MLEDDGDREEDSTRLPTLRNESASAMALVYASMVEVGLAMVLEG